MNRRHLITAAVLGSGVSGLANKNNSKPIKSSVHDSGKNEFSLILSCEEFNGKLFTGNDAFSVTCQNQQNTSIVKISGQTYRQKQSSKSVTLKDKITSVVITWKSSGYKGELTLYMNYKFTTNLNFKSPGKHASPYIKEFNEIFSEGIKLKSYQELDFCIDASAMECLSLNEIPQRKSNVQSCIGPYVGQVTHNKAAIWLRGYKNTLYQLSVFHNGKKIFVEKKTTQKTNDFCLQWNIQNLKSGMRYKYLVETKDLSIGGKEYFFKTTTENNTQSVKLLFGSCADIQDTPLYQQISKINPDGVFFMGDTPYIDHGDLTVQRHSHRQFLQIESFQKILKNTPFMGTWDDHDFGLNNSDGNFKHKKNSIKAFKEYRPQFSYGDGQEGIYTNIRFGPLEIFLIDARWFSYTEKSFINPDEKTLLGKKQWQWLTKLLKASTATFKVLVCGMIWDDKENKEKDDWHTYGSEKKAVFNYIRENNIEGVCLLGGDIHVSRLLKYDKNLIGYDLYQFISSPMHNSVIKSLNVKHEALKWSALQKNTFITLEVTHKNTKTSLIVNFINKEGKSIKLLEIPAETLTRQKT